MRFLYPLFLIFLFPMSSVQSKDEIDNCYHTSLRKVLSFKYALEISTCRKKQKPPLFEKIIIGSGGGITGKTNEYIINNEGVIVFKQGGKEDTAGFRKITKKQLKDIAKKADANGFKTTNLNEPGNFYYYIECTENGKSHRVTWSKNKSDANPKMQELYDFIMEVVMKAKKQ
jgi:hypothetical protein